MEIIRERFVLFGCLHFFPFSRASVSTDGGIKNPRAKALWDKWRHVWMMAWERDRRLRDKLNYLLELENVKNFDWEEWRKRYLKFNNNKKSRVQDFFRKLDDDGDGYCPRDEFIDGILKAKFPSSKLELNAVADKVDVNSEFPIYRIHNKTFRKYLY